MKQITLFILMMLLPMMAIANGNGTFGESLTWSYVSETKTLTISGTGAMINYYSLPWSSFRSSIQNVIIESGVTSIGYNAFSDCSSLTSVTIPNSVTSIGDDAFYGCSSLTSVTIPSSVTEIGSGAFHNTAWYDNQPEGLIYAGNVAYKYKGTMPENTSIQIKDGTVGIAVGAFSGCSGLTSVTIPSSVTVIGGRAFEGTGWYDNQPEGLIYAGNVAYEYKGTMPENTSIQIKDGTVGIAVRAFYGCSGLTSITIPNSVTSIERQAFYGCSGLTSVTTPFSVMSIGDNAFSNCSSLTSVTIPNSVTSIGSSAFSSCSSLTSVTIPNSVTSIEGMTFYGCSGLTSVTIPNSVTSIGNGAFEYCSGLTSVTIPNSVKSIGEDAFEYCSSITSITIPNSVTSIGERAFSGCNDLTNIVVEEDNTIYDSREGCNAIIRKNDNELIAGCKNTIIPNSVTSIGEYAFSVCLGLTSITIPNSVTSIGDCAFQHCIFLTSVTIPNSVTSIGEDAFYNTGWYYNQPDGLVYAGKVAYKIKGGMPNTSISIKDGTLGIADRAFGECDWLTSVTIPDGVTSIGDYTFYGCNRLTSVMIPNSVTSIGEGAFMFCRGLTSVTIPYSVMSIESRAFYGCISLTSVTIPYSVTSIGDYTFYGCSSLTSVTIPFSVTSIGDNAFRDCSSLTSVTIPNSVTSIGNYAFSGCSSLTSIISLRNTPPTCTQDINDNYTQFNYVNKSNCILWVPIGSVNAYKEANAWNDFLNIKEIVVGDFNLDNEVDKDDMDALISYIMGKDPKGFNKSVADLNNDGLINAADIVEFVEIFNNR